MAYGVDLLSRERAIEEGSPVYGVIVRLSKDGKVAEDGAEAGTLVSVRHTDTDQELIHQEAWLSAGYAPNRQEVTVACQAAADYIADIHIIDFESVYPPEFFTY